MTYRIALNFEDGVTRFIDCKPTETVADAAYRQSINVPIDCRDGACGACKCSCESGSFRLGDYIDDALSQSEADAGMVLTCQMYPQGDCVVRVPASSDVCKTKQASFSATIADLRQLSDSTISLTLAGEALNKLAFLPGQYANLAVPGTPQHRAYSYSSMPADGKVSFLIRNVPGGLMSGYLREQAKAGDSITMAGPLGSFYLREIKRPVLMLAGGTGLAPFLAMLDKVVADGGSSQPIHLIYGVNTDTDLVELDKLAAFAAALPNFTYALVVVAADSAQPKKGYVTQHIEPAQLNDGDVDIYLCGPPPMVEAVAQNLRERAIQPASFHYEKFAASV
ncbi:ring-hydroxylating dioxygenase ferredoxin reductase family protein [Dechloromonas sp. XY25]|uniref:Ring-hydroxylating dioxygenase ferredoxin reductase family protein n=1 Tax=Dechloromonas hankyongensis TaxID=2908002 RepID=A0ABS9K229_9RHOO|nr:benzoate 1,2-dioxygenase electron transfer component BenC [Dechloromonas hankyongensis]MCG2577203.1 ring-hydroxylating dioxygenase ferredoxin reductase family protein [Dechloromonas hankyongensis]